MEQLKAGAKSSTNLVPSATKKPVSSRNFFCERLLISFILRRTKLEKRIVFAQDVNKNKEMWQSDDAIEDYRKEIEESWIESAKAAAESGADIGGIIGKTLGGPAGEAIGRAAGAVIGGVVSIGRSIWRGIFG